MTILLFILASALLVLNIISMGVLTLSGFSLVWKEKSFAFSSIPVLGIVSYSLYTFLVGSTLGLNIFLLCLPIPILFFFTGYLRKLFEGGGEFLRDVSSRKYMLFNIALLVVFTFSFLRIFGTRVFGDSLVYHLYLPQQYVNAGYIFRVPFSEHALWPQLVEMFFTFTLKFESVPASKFFSFFIYILLGIFTSLFTRTLTKDTFLSYLSGFFILLTPAYFFYSAGTYVDLTLTLFTISMMYFIYRYYMEGPKIFLVIAAVCCAGALLIKFTSIMILAAILPLIVIKSRGKNKLYDVCIFLGICLVFGSLWYLRSYLLSGNPIFPFGHNLFGKGFPSNTPVENMTFLGRLVSARTGSDTGIGRGLVHFLMLPFDLTFRSFPFGGEKIGFLYMVMFPFFLYSFSLFRKYWLLQVFMILFVVQWFLLDQMMRFFFPILPLYVCVSFVALSKVWDKRFLKPVFLTVITPLIIFQTLWSGYYFYQDFEYIFKGTNRVDQMDYSYRLALFVRDQDITDGKILLVGSNNLFYMPSNTIRENTFRNFTRYDLKSDKIAFLREEGIDYVLMNVSEGSRKERKGYNPHIFFRAEIDKTLKPVARHQDEYVFVLYEISE